MAAHGAIGLQGFQRPFNGKMAALCGMGKCAGGGWKGEGLSSDSPSRRQLVSVFLGSQHHGPGAYAMDTSKISEGFGDLQEGTGASVSAVPDGAAGTGTAPGGVETVDAVPVPHPIGLTLTPEPAQARPTLAGDVLAHTIPAPAAPGAGLLASEAVLIGADLPREMRFVNPLYLVEHNGVTYPALSNMPVDQAAFEQLRATGIVSDTLIWVDLRLAAPPPPGTPSQAGQ